MTKEEKQQQIQELKKQMLARLNKLEKLARSIKKRPAKTPKGAIGQAAEFVSIVIEAAKKHRQIELLETQKPDFHPGGKFSKNEEKFTIPKDNSLILPREILLEMKKQRFTISKRNGKILIIDRDQNAGEVYRDGESYKVRIVINLSYMTSKECLALAKRMQTWYYFTHIHPANK